MTANDREFQDTPTEALRALVRELDENRRRMSAMHDKAARALKRRVRKEREASAIASIDNQRPACHIPAVILADRTCSTEKAGE